MNKNIQIVPYGGLIDNSYPHLFLNGTENLVRDITGLDYSIKCEEEQEVIKSVKDNKEDFKFVCTIENFNIDQISLKMNWLFLVYDEFIDLSKIQVGKFFSGYITKINKTYNNYEFRIKRTSQIYDVELFNNNYWLDVAKYKDIQTAYTNTAKEFLIAKETDNFNISLVKRIAFSQVVYKPLKNQLIIYMNNGDGSKNYNEYKFSSDNKQIFTFSYIDKLGYQIDNTYKENNDYIIQKDKYSKYYKVISIGNIQNNELVKPDKLYYLSLKEYRKEKKE